MGIDHKSYGIVEVKTPAIKTCVDHPAHYNFSEIEPIDAIEAWELDFNLGNVIKYIARHKHKGDPLTDLKKARWFLDRAISQMERQ